VTISVVQTTVTGTLGTSVTFSSSVTPGNTILLVIGEYSAPTVTVSGVKLGGSTVTGTTQLEFPQTAGGGSPQGCCIVMLPNVQASGQTVVDYTCSGSVIGAYAIEVSGLGSSPTLDQSITATGATGTVTTGTTGSTTVASEFVFCAAANYNGSTNTFTGSSWTGQTVTGSNHLCVAYIIQTTSAQTYNASQIVGGTAGWAAAIVTLYAGGSASVSGALATSALAAPAGSVSAGAAVSGAVAPLALAAPAGSVTTGAGPAGAVAPLALAAPAGSVAASSTVAGAVAAASLAAPAGSPSGGTVVVTATWTGSEAPPAVYTFPPPAARPLQIPVTNTAGDWLFAIVTWRQPAAGQGVTVSVADDAHNWWEPLGAPSGDSSAAGVTRTAVWAAPAARVANSSTGVTNVQVAPSAPYLAVAAIILDVSGMQPWMTMTPVVTNYANASSSLSLSAAAPSAQAFLVTGAGTDNNADTITGPGAGWTSLTAVTASDGTDHAGDVQLSSAWRVTTGSTTAAWSSSGSLDLSGVIAGVLVSGTAPSQPNPNWPVVITEVALGSGAHTPPALLTWTPASSRVLASSVQQGRQYTLAQLQAAQGTITFDDADGALIPPGAGSFAGIDSGTPVRQRVIVPAAASPYYVAFSGYLQRWPFALPGDMLRGQTIATVTDAWGYAAGLLNSMAREEVLIDSPYAFWPLDDATGAPAGSNIAPGNANPLTLTLSKYGAGGATQEWAQNSGALIGDSSAKITTTSGDGGAEGMWSQTLAGTSLNTNGYGYALVCADQNYPAVSGGVTIECWFENATAEAPGWNVGFTAATSGSLFTASGFATGDPVAMTVATGFTLPGGFSANTVYYVIGATGSTFQLSATLGGSAITVTSSGAGYLKLVTPWNGIVFSARNVRGAVAEVDVRTTDGALVMLYRTAAGATSTVVLDSSHDYRIIVGMCYVSLAFNQTSWRAVVGGIGANQYSGTFSAALPSAFTELDFGGVQDRAAQGGAWTGYLALAAVTPGMLAPIRAFSHYLTAAYGAVNEAACDRVERVLEYAGLTGRRWIGQQVIADEGDLATSGQDIGGQGAATSAGNIAASTVPAMMYVAPTGDAFYAAKWYQWNQPVRWTLGDNAAGGEIPFLPAQFSTDYDNARVVNDVQLTQLDTQTVTVPSGMTSATTAAAVVDASQLQYGDQPYQVTGYLTADGNSPYSAGGSMVDLADWIGLVNAKPKTRVPAITVNAAANSANASSSKAWQFWAGASVGDMVQVNLRLPTAATSPLISLVARITQTQRTGQFSQDGTSATIACVLDFAPEYTALICDDPVRGLLNGQNVLAW
jgi:hypothetical protein